MDNHLAQKTAIITGASSGIGRATALALAKTGASVVIYARRKGMNYCKYGLTILAALILTACSGSYNNSNFRGNLIGAPTVTGTMTTAQIDAWTAGSGLQELTGTAQCDVTVVQINYQTPGAHPSEMTNASAAILVPSGANCPGPFPLVAYARGTEALKSRTMANPTDAETISLMAFFAAHGYVVVATDFLGYALSNYAYHPYAHADSEASSVIDSIRATRKAASSLGLSLNGKVMVTGYSQGGHSSMATQRAIERDNAKEINLVAAAHLAGPYYISAALVDGVKNPILGVQAIVPFEVTSWQKIYGNVYDKATDVFNSPYDSYIETLLPTINPEQLASKLPSGTPVEARDKMFKSAYLSDLASNPNNGTIVAAKKQDLLGWNPKASTILCGGLKDPTVSFSINAIRTYNDFKSRGGANIEIVDVNSKIQQRYGSVFESDPEKYNSSYHATYEPPFCYQVAKALFDVNK
jgi:pimeloyl-ACP methyl ester carboxylesterase